MQAVVKTPHTNFRIEGDIAPDLIKVLKDMYGKNLELIEDEDEQYVDVMKTDWFKQISEEITPGDSMKIYRENRKWTQKQLGEKLGGISVQNISHYENNRRAISKILAKKLAQLFNVPVDRFI